MEKYQKIHYLNYVRGGICVSHSDSLWYFLLYQYIQKGCGAETTDFGPLPDLVVLLFDGYTMILVSKNQNFITICCKIIVLCRFERR